MKATALLKKQHRAVERLLDKLEDGSTEWASDLNELANNLAAHMAIEQNLFYPAARDVDDTLVRESYEEHAIAELALKRLLATAGDDATFSSRVTALKELIAHHVEEEEETLFPEVEEKMEAGALTALADEMSAAFDEALKEGYKSLLPEGLEASADAVQQVPSDAPSKEKHKRGPRKRRTMDSP
jgi:hemerythrin-like domain-containing protein